MGHLDRGAFTYGVRFLGWLVGQAASDFTKQAYVVKYLISTVKAVTTGQGKITQNRQSTA